MRQRTRSTGRVILAAALLISVATSALAQKTVESVEKGRRRVVRYDERGALLEVGEQVDEKDLPPPVAGAMHSHRRAIFVTALKFTRGKDVRYELTLRGSRKTAMVVKPDGTVVSFE